MANLNLSQFTEKTLVADADWVFVWDTAGSISKKVSRNSLLNSGTLATSAPVTISQTWDAGTNVMTALKVVATDTASGTASNLLELWAGSTPALDFAVTKAGAVQSYGTYSSAGANYARLALACDSSGNATISTQALGTGTAGTVSINGVPVGQGKGVTAYNIAIGLNSLINKTTSAQNCAIGVNSGILLTSGDFNVLLGNDTLLANTTGSYNIAVGVTAGRYITGGATANALTNNSVYLGALTKANASGESNQIVIGYDATGLGSNTAVLGNASITTTALRGNVGIGTTAPSSKLQVTGGDVEIETVTSGIIMKAAGTSTRYRITLNAGGTALVFTAI